MVEGTGLSSYEQTFAHGDYLFREGDRSACLYVIRSGQVKLLKVVDAHEYLVGEAGPGDFVGEVGSMAGLPNSVTAKASAPTQCWRLDVVALERLIEADRELSARLMIAMAKRIAGSQNLLSVYASRDPFFRVCKAMLHLAETQAEPQPGGVLLPERLTEMGARLKLTADETAEVSKTLMRNKLIRIRRDGVLLPDTQRLEQHLAKCEASEPARR